jgi:hypothetical protein
MNPSRVKTFLGFAIKANKALFGVDRIIISRRPPKIVLIDKLLSENSKKKLIIYLEKYEIRNYTVDMQAIYPDKNCKVVGIMDKNLASAIESEVKES